MVALTCPPLAFDLTIICIGVITSFVSQTDEGQTPSMLAGNGSEPILARACAIER